MTEGRKDDFGKPPWTLLPWRATAAVVDVLSHGAAKYAPDNWRKVSDPRNRYFSAAMRHLVAWRLGEKNDPDSGLPHLAHVGCCVLFLLELELGLGPTSAELGESQPNKEHALECSMAPGGTPCDLPAFVFDTKGQPLCEGHAKALGVLPPMTVEPERPVKIDVSRAPWDETVLREHGFKAFNWEKGVVIDVKTGTFLCVLGAPEPVDFKKVREDWEKKQKEVR